LGVSPKIKFLKNKAATKLNDNIYLGISQQLQEDGVINERYWFNVYTGEVISYS